MNEEKKKDIIEGMLAGAREYGVHISREEAEATLSRVDEGFWIVDGDVPIPADVNSPSWTNPNSITSYEERVALINIIRILLAGVAGLTRDPLKMAMVMAQATHMCKENGELTLLHQLRRAS